MRQQLSRKPCCSHDNHCLLSWKQLSNLVYRNLVVMATVVNEQGIPHGVSDTHAGILMVLTAAFEFDPVQAKLVKGRPSDDGELNEICALSRTSGLGNTECLLSLLNCSLFGQGLCLTLISRRRNALSLVPTQPRPGSLCMHTLRNLICPLIPFAQVHLPLPLHSG